MRHERSLTLRLGLLSCLMPHASCLMASCLMPGCAARRRAWRTRASAAPMRLVLVDQYVRYAVLADPASVHPFGVERHREVSVAVEDDAAAVAHLWFEVLELVVDHFVAGLLDGHPFVFVERGDVVGDGVADEVLACAGGGDGDGVVRGVGAGADDRGVADAAELLVRRAAGRRAGGEIAFLVERDGAHGPV